MPTKEGPSTVLHAERRFTGKRPTPAISLAEGITRFYFIPTSFILSVFAATFSCLVITQNTRSTCSTSSGGKRSACMIAEVSMGPSIVDEKGYWRGVIEELQIKFTLEYIAAEIGVSERQVSNWKAGDRPKGMRAEALLVPRET
jgi:hypothetical protein